MIWSLLALGAAAYILCRAGRIVLGWVLTPAALARVDAAVVTVDRAIGQFVILTAAAVILWLIWALAHAGD